MVVKFKFQLFYKKSAYSMISLNGLNEFISVQKAVQKCSLFSLINGEKLKNLIGFGLTKSQIAYGTTQGIANKDVIIRTKLRKIGNLSLKEGLLMTKLAYGFVCGIMNFYKEKIEIQPLNMVLSKTK